MDRIAILNPDHRCYGRYFFHFHYYHRCCCRCFHCSSLGWIVTPESRRCIEYSRKQWHHPSHNRYSFGLQISITLERCYWHFSFSSFFFFTLIFLFFSIIIVIIIIIIIIIILNAIIIFIFCVLDGPFSFPARATNRNYH